MNAPARRRRVYRAPSDLTLVGGSRLHRRRPPRIKCFDRHQLILDVARDMISTGRRVVPTRISGLPTDAAVGGIVSLVIRRTRHWLSQASVLDWTEKYTSRVPSRPQAADGQDLRVSLQLRVWEGTRDLAASTRA